MKKLHCGNYMGDSGFHLFVHCMRKGIVTAAQCMQCENREISDARVNSKREIILGKENRDNGDEGE